jgi:hypothetical protein
MRILAVLLVSCALAGCGAAALPCRVSSAAIKVVPLVGHPVATPLDACAEAIDG